MPTSTPADSPQVTANDLRNLLNPLAQIRGIAHAGYYAEGGNPNAYGPTPIAYAFEAILQMAKSLEADLYNFAEELEDSTAN